MSERALEQRLDREGTAAPPRSNGELLFQAPWESRVFGLTMALCEQDRFEWDEFRERLIASIAAQERALGPEDAFCYYACWLEALRSLLVDKHLCGPETLAERELQLAARPPGHDH